MFWRMSMQYFVFAMQHNLTFSASMLSLFCLCEWSALMLKKVSATANNIVFCTKWLFFCQLLKASSGLNFVWTFVGCWLLHNLIVKLYRHRSAKAPLAFRAGKKIWQTEFGVIGMRKKQLITFLFLQIAIRHVQICWLPRIYCS